MDTKHERPAVKPNLLPPWSIALLALVTVLALLGWLSPDMRAHAVALWAACM